MSSLKMTSDGRLCNGCRMLEDLSHGYRCSALCRYGSARALGPVHPVPTLCSCVPDGGAATGCRLRPCRINAIVITITG
jgi:hypothetical protein